MHESSSQLITSEELYKEKQRIFVEARSGVSLPAAGAVYWLALGIAGFYLSQNAWCLAAFVTSGLIFPLGMLLSKPLGADLFIESPLANLFFPALLPVGLSFALTIPMYFVDPSLVPLGLAVGMSLHWPTIGWIYGKPAFVVHAVVRVVLVVVIWFAIPSATFTGLPLSVGFVYVATFAWLLFQVRRAETPAS